MKKRVLCLFLALALLLGAVPARAGAAGTSTIRCGSDPAAQQGYVYLSVEAQALENLAALELTVFYDPQVLEFQHADAGWLLSEQIVSVHHDVGSITLTAASIGGISGDGSLMTMGFTVRVDCAPGRYPLVLAVGEAYDTSRSPVSIAAQNGSVTFTEYAPSYGEFRLGLETDRTTLAPGEIVTATADFYGETYTDERIVYRDELGHDYAWTVRTEPGCTTNTCTRCGEKRKNPFTDVPAGSFYHDPVIWAVENGITSGTSETTFGTGNPCNRAQVVTFLYKAFA